MCCCILVTEIPVLHMSKKIEDNQGCPNERRIECKYKVNEKQVGSAMASAERFCWLPTELDTQGLTKSCC